MLDHFAKQTPLKSVHQYPTIHAQENRFIRAGYLNASGQSLWDYWESGSLYYGDKVHLDKVEPFDEWEEFILFASHYVVLHAYGDDRFYNQERILSDHIPARIEDKSNHRRRLIVAQHGPISKQSIGQRMSSAIKFEGFNSERVTVFVPSSTPTTTNREWTCYSSEAPELWPSSIPLTGLSYFTITRVGNDSYLLVGGRTSPSKANSKCFLYRRPSNTWTEVHSLEFGRYRHCAESVKVGTENGVLIFGGRTGRDDYGILSDWLLWTEKKGWTALSYTEPNTDDEAVRIPILFGATMMDGILLGGIGLPYRINRKIWRWSLEPVESGSPNSSLSITLHSVATIEHQTFSARFSASIINLPSIGPVVIGGVAPVPLKLHEEAYGLVAEKGVELIRLFDNTVPRPLLIGNIVSHIGSEYSKILITGGGGVCFSFGSCFNTHWYIIQNSDINQRDAWRCFTASDQPSVTKKDKSLAETFFLECRLSTPNERVTTKVTECRLANVSKMTRKSIEPVISHGVVFGSCQELWDLKYLEQKIGLLHIAIHEAQSRNLIFTPQKNFKYRTCTFSEFTTMLEQKKHVYLRALAGNHSFKEPANFWKDFLAIADDFVIPSDLRKGFDLDTKLHSAVLRVSGDVSVWIHYDVMSNFYFQVRGSKTFILFPPTEALKLNFAPGNTSSPMNTQSDFSNIAHKIVQVNAGDVLFIPRFWAHATFNEAEDCQTSIAVNIFWRDLDLANYAAGKDVYGNRDLAVYEHGREVVWSVANRLRSQEGEKAGGKALEVALFLVEGTQLDAMEEKEIRSVRSRLLKMPVDVSQFYLSRLADELVQLVGA
jgi:tRNA wybutosine-synthesizing protein 4